MRGLRIVAVFGPDSRDFSPAIDKIILERYSIETKMSKKKKSSWQRVRYYLEAGIDLDF